MSNATPTETFLTADAAALRLGVPPTWLKAEAAARRIPCLKAGRRTLFNIEQVERVLIARASQPATAGGAA